MAVIGQYVILPVLLLAIAVGPSVAADMPSSPPPPTTSTLSPERVATAIENYVTREAALLTLRARFDVVPLDDVPVLLRQQLEALSGNEPSAWIEDKLDRDLLAEMSYFAISLKYLIESGGSLWPGDRDESSYVNDALVELDAVLDEIPDAVQGHADPLPLLRRLERIYWWTEGYAEAPAGEDHFEGVEALIGGALDDAGPRAAT